MLRIETLQGPQNVFSCNVHNIMLGNIKPDVTWSCPLRLYSACRPLWLNRTISQSFTHNSTEQKSAIIHTDILSIFLQQSDTWKEKDCTYETDECSNELPLISKHSGAAGMNTEQGLNWLALHCERASCDKMLCHNVVHCFGKTWYITSKTLLHCLASDPHVQCLMRGVYCI